MHDSLVLHIHAGELDRLQAQHRGLRGRANIAPAPGRGAFFLLGTPSDHSHHLGLLEGQHIFCTLQLCRWS